MSALRNSEEWAARLGWQILDPDGWDRRDFERSWAEEITEEEFVKRAGVSTARRVVPEFTPDEWATWERFEAAEPVTGDDE